MVGKQESADESAQHEQRDSGPADADVWAQLGKLASREGSDPVLHLLISEAQARYEELRGVTATIASRYRSMVDAIPDAVVIHDESGNVTDANEAACKLFKREREKILQSTLFSLVPGLDPEFLSALHEASTNELSLTTSSSIRHEDGSTSDLELHGREYLDRGRVRIITVVRDLGQREIATRGLRDSESWLRNLMHAVDKGVLVWSRAGRILSANPAACRILRMSEAELRALGPYHLEQWRYLDEHGHPLEAAALPWLRAFATGKPQESAICGIDLPGENSTLWLSVSAVPNHNPDAASIEKAICVFSEITNLQVQAMMFAETQSLINLGTWRLDLESHVLLCSAQMHSIFDVPMSTPLTRERMLSHFSAADLDRFRQAIVAAREGHPDQFEARMTTSIGRKRLVRIRLRPLRSGASVNAVFGTLRDITSGSTDTSANSTRTVDQDSSQLQV